MLTYTSWQYAMLSFLAGQLDSETLHHAYIWFGKGLLFAHQILLVI